jgi:inositol phosphorylceramide mannosyltransferase catalytic subunit
MKSLINIALAIRGSLNRPADYGFIPTLTTGNSIPKIIHQTYYKKTLPHELQENVDYLKKLNPDWEYKLYDDADIEIYIKEHYPQILHLYQSINPSYGAARADFFRYLVMYKEGGIYLDIKSSMSKPINEIIQPNDSYLLCHWDNEVGGQHEHIGHHKCLNNQHGEYQQWHIIATQGHPYLKAVIENVCHNISHYTPILHDTGGWAVVNMTGPIAYTLAIKSVLNQYHHRLARDNNAFHLVYSIYEQQGIALGHHDISRKHYTINTDSLVELSTFSKFLFFICKPIILFIKKTLLKYK